MFVRLSGPQGDENLHSVQGPVKMNVSEYYYDCTSVYSMSSITRVRVSSCLPSMSLMIWRPRGSKAFNHRSWLLFSSFSSPRPFNRNTPHRTRCCPTVLDAEHRPRPRTVAILLACSEERGHGDLNAAHLSLYRPQVSSYTTR